jgi:hypothetical protein
LGPLTDYVAFSPVVQRLAEHNHTPNAVIYAPGVAGMVDRLVDSLGNPTRGPASWDALAKFSTNQAGAGEAYIARLVAPAGRHAHRYRHRGHPRCGRRRRQRLPQPCRFGFEPTPAWMRWSVSRPPLRS